MADLEALGLGSAELEALRAAAPRLLRWFAGAARAMPWRESRDPYAIWVSEVMLQQTQVSTVVPYYERWLAELPDVRALAAAEEAQVLKLWEGLGYYSRARNLHRAARVVVAEHDAQVPRDPSVFRQLPGVGAYTAAAVTSIAFGARVAAVDGNVRRVLSRLVALERDPTRARESRGLEALAAALLEASAGDDLEGPSRHNQAMMELGALVCVPRAPRCEQCPMGAACLGLRSGEPTRFPPRKARRAVPHHDLAVAIALDARSGEMLLEKRPERGLLAGLWDLPQTRVDEAAAADEAARVLALSQLLAERYGLRGARVERQLTPVGHVFTHLRVTLHPTVLRVSGASSRASEGGEARRWVSRAAIAEHALPTATRKVLSQLWSAAKG
ncbi:MAG: A/G-specific adenine glycosylase [Myxococcales bacterium]|nr:A/G-specific adenine glycosylase [Myxococcales bacterium]